MHVLYNNMCVHRVCKIFKKNPKKNKSKKQPITPQEIQSPGHFQMRFPNPQPEGTDLETEAGQKDSWCSRRVPLGRACRAACAAAAPGPARFSKAGGCGSPPCCASCPALWVAASGEGTAGREKRLQPPRLDLVSLILESKSILPWYSEAKSTSRQFLMASKKHCRKKLLIL